MNERKPSLYEQLKAAGCVMDNHQSDLYVKATPAARAIVDDSGFAYTTFRDAIDGDLWIEIPFAYMPWWETHTPRDCVDPCAGEGRVPGGDYINPES